MLCLQYQCCTAMTLYIIWYSCTKLFILIQLQCNTVSVIFMHLFAPLTRQHQLYTRTNYTRQLHSRTATCTIPVPHTYYIWKCTIHTDKYPIPFDNRDARSATSYGSTLTCYCTHTLVQFLPLYDTDAQFSHVTLSLKHIIHEKNQTEKVLSHFQLPSSAICVSTSPFYFVARHIGVHSFSTTFPSPKVPVQLGSRQPFHRPQDRPSPPAPSALLSRLLVRQVRKKAVF